MYSQDNSYSSTNQLDFSSAFMRASSNEQISSMQMSNEDVDRPVTSDTLQQQSVSENRNLSSILSHIRDEGSIRTEPEKKVSKNRKGSHKGAVAPAGIAASIQQKQQAQARPLNNSKEQYSNLYEFSTGEEMNTSQHSEKNVQNKQRQSSWLPLALSLALTVMAVMGFNLYQLNDQANEMRVTLSAYEEQVDELSTTQKQSSGALLAVSGISEELTGLKQQIHAIKSDYADIDSKLAQSSMNSLRPQQQEIATVKQEVSKLEGSLKTTRTEITAIKSAMDKVKKSLVVQKDIVEPGRWTVNLASLSSKEQAQIGVTMLEKSGRVPVVHEIKVKGETVYRLSVEGFSTRQEAMWFIGKAKKQYGFDGGWVTQS